MSILFVLIPLAVLMLGVALAAFFWAVGHDQFDDLETPALRAIRDHQPPSKPTAMIAVPRASNFNRKGPRSRSVDCPSTIQIPSGPW